MSDPTPVQTLILWCLLARHGRAPQGEVVPAVGKADREALAAAGLLSVEKLGRSLVLTVTDRGWHWAGAHLGAPLPPGVRVVQDLLGRLDRHLRETRRTLADFIGPAPEPVAAAPASKPPRRTRTVSAKAALPRTARETGRTRAGSVGAAPEPGAAAPETKAVRRTPAPATKPAPRPRAAPGKASRSRPAREPDPDHLRARIEDAYLALTGGERARAVRLSELRARLAEFDRATVDGGLARILKGDATARLSQFSDPRSLTPAERAAAYSPAGEPFHILWIQ